MVSFFASAALSAIAYSAVASAAVAKYCPPSASGVCYSVGVPSSSAKAGSGNIYFQITAPTSYTWVALGTGSTMPNSNIFLMYQDGAGNVTISPRRGTSYTAPTEDTSSTAAKLTLLAGSGVSGNTMTANVACSNCQSWANNGKMSLSSTSTNWVSAWKAGSSLGTTSKSATITRHDNHDEFGFDLTQAVLDTDTNPYVSSGGSGSGGNTGSGGNNGTNTGSGSGSNTGGGSSTGVTAPSGSSSLQETKRLVSAHGVIMSIVFVILYPLGSVLMPLLGNWVLHAGFQFVAFALMWAGFGIGVVVSQRLQMNFSVVHTQFGVAVVCLMILQPVFGYLHHMHFVKNQKRGVISYVHIAYGRALMLMGVVNGGLGLQLADESMSLVVAYAIVAAVVFVIYAVAKGFTSFKKRRHSGGPSAVRGTRGVRIPDRNKESSSEGVELPRRDGRPTRAY